ncbi:MAG: hypothetical protein KC516_02730 [Nanoarchaeota archaeon]|nr:hypothetical protein [Nanoarchaeota archaeon]
MKLEILSFVEALKYNPEMKSYAIRIEGSFDNYILLNPLKDSENWVKIKPYYFDDNWPSNWKEYSWYDTKNEEFQNYLHSQQEIHPKMTEESLMAYLESRGHPYGRYTLFDESIAKKILEDFEKVENQVENVVIHCIDGKNRAPAVGIAMDEIFNWGTEGLKEKFPEYRRFVYNKMIGVAKKR